MRKVFTLLFLVNGERVLLGIKRRKHGKGYWNGPGGGVEEGEDVVAAAVRECEEEVGVTPRNVQNHGVLVFIYPSEPLGAREHEVHIFTATSYEGDIVETEEMQSPTWFSFKEVPYAQMWPDDEYWLPKVLQGEKVSGTFEFGADMSLATWDVQLLD